MKIKFLLSAFFTLMLGAGVSFGQHTKIGYTDPEYILQLLPEYKQIESELKSYEKQLQTQIEGKMKEYQAKLEDYQRMIGSPTPPPDVVRQDKEKELLAMQGSIKEFEETAMSSYQKKQGALLEPVIDKVEKAIEEVAKENGYTYILNHGAANVTVILYAKNKDEDISDLVLKRLGVTPPVKTEGATGTGNTNPNPVINPGPVNPGTGNKTTAPVKKQ